MRAPSVCGAPARHLLAGGGTAQQVRPLSDVALAGADVVTLLHRYYENAPVADVAGARRTDHGFDDVVGEFILDDEFDHDFREQSDVVFGSPVDRLVTLLPAVAANLRDGHARDVQFRQSVLYFFEFVGAN